MSIKKRTKRQATAILLNFLLVFSLFAPQISYAETNADIDLNTIEEDLELEKELEEVAADQEKRTGEHNASEAPEGGAVPRLDDVEVSGSEADDASHKVKNGSAKSSDLIDLFAEADEVDVIIHMKDGDSASLNDFATEALNRTERIAKVQEHLQHAADKSQAKILKELDKLNKKEAVSNIEPLWIINGIAATVTKEAYEKLAARDDVEKILQDDVYHVPEPMESETEPRLPEWGLEKVNAPKVWGQYGVNGEGIVVGIMDTGVEGTHEALASNYRGRDGDHQHSWADFSGDGYNEPGDGNGHGTHVAGSAVGGGEGEPVGVAPGAEWIAAKIFNDGGRASTSGIHQAFQWFMAPGGDPALAPHVVNNSWGNSNTYMTEFAEDVDAWLAAGIFPLFAAGNDGPGAETIGSPASLPGSFAIGATDVNDQIAPFSSRGPVTWDGQRYIKPEVSAPGAAIYSAWPGNTYNTISGTSMAAPHATGVIALMLEANPDLSIDEIKQVLMQTARDEMHMGELPNMNYGHGIIDSYQSVTEVAFAGEISGMVTDDEGDPIPARIQIEEEHVDYSVEDDGMFSFKLREGTHEVIIESFGYETQTTDISVTKGETTHVEWELARSDQFNIKGKVTDHDGEPVSFAYVRLLDTPLDTLRTDEDGRFEFTKIPNGTYDLVVSGKNVAGTSERVEVTQDLELEISVDESSRVADGNWLTANNQVSRNAVSDEDISLDNFESNWTKSTRGHTVFSSPVVNEDTIIITSDQGYVEAFDLVTGEEKWMFRSSGLNRGTPTIVDDIVIVPGGQDGKIHALDLESGAVEWEVSTGNLPIYETPLYDDGTIYISSNTDGDTNVIALDIKDGQTKWTKTIPGNSYFGAALADDRLILGSYEGRTLYALSIEDGTELWSVESSGEGFASMPTVVDNVVYALSTNFDARGTLWAVDVSSGEELWKVDGIGDTQAASPVIYDDVLVVSSASIPVLKGFDRHSGELLWENKNVNTTVNNGAVTSNGLFFIADQTSMLKAVDVMSGDLLDQWALDSSSTATPAIVSGQVVVGAERGLAVFSSPGVLSGKISDADGEPLAGFARFVGTDQVAEADENGYFELPTMPGEYEVRVGMYGYDQVEETLIFRSGYQLEKEYTLDRVDEGKIVGQVVDSRNNEAIENVTVDVLDTPLQTTTNAKGAFEFDPIHEGNYEIALEAGGYVSSKVTASVSADDTVTLTAELDPIDVAVLNDYEATITTLLNKNSIPAEEREWDGLLADLDEYQVVYLNGAYRSGGWKPDEDDVRSLVDAAESSGVSVVFTDTWGPNYGSIQHLMDVYEDPQLVQSDSSDTTVSLKVEMDHPIFGDKKVGDRMDVVKNGKASWFNGYSGRDLATLGSHRSGDLGTGIAYKAVSEDSAHLLLSSHATSSWNLPGTHWLKDQHDLLINSVNYLIDDATYGKLEGQVMDQDGNDLQAKIEVRESSVSVQSGEDGSFTMYHDEGTTEVEVRLAGYKTEVIEVDFKHGEPSIETIVLQNSEGGQLSGVVTDSITASPIEKVDVTLYNSGGDPIDEAVTASNGYYEFTGMDSADYLIEFHHDDYVTAEGKASVSEGVAEHDQTLDPVPKVAILGDKSYGDDTLEAILADVNIEATNYTSIETLTNEMEHFDVVFFNEVGMIDEQDFKAFEAALDDHHVSVIYGDQYFSGGGIYTLNRFNEDPAIRETINTRDQAAQYVIQKEHPLFDDREPGEKIEILTPDGSRVSVFDEYSGFILADIAHGNGDPHGSGIGYKPRTSGSLELLMSGHSVDIAHSGDDYTGEGLKMFTKAAIWAANERFNTVRGSVTDKDGNPLKAEITVEIDDASLTDVTTEEDEAFDIAAPDGTALVTITSYGYQTQSFTVNIDGGLEPFTIQLAEKETVGAIEGYVSNSLLLDGVADVHINVVDYPRETTTDVNGYYHIGVLEPGTYEIELAKDGFLQESLTVDISDGETKTIDVDLRPSPNIGIIVDAQSSSAMTLAEYLEDRGFETTSMFYDDLELLDEVDLVFANSDYNNDLIPDEEMFKDFLEALDQTGTSVIWTGQHGGKGSIRYLIDYERDPGIEDRGSGAGKLAASILEEHPIFEGVEETFDYTTQSGYYYGFDDYTGTILADYTKEDAEDGGHFIGFKGRTASSVEVLLGGMTIGHGFHPNDKHFDENREKIINNSILWAIDHTTSHAGEVHGTVLNDLDEPVQASVTVEQTGKTVIADSEGEFFLGLGEGTYTIALEAFGHQSGTATVDIENGQALEETFVLDSDSVGRLSGEVRAQATGDLIEGAKIEVLDTGLSSKTDDSGKYSLTVPEGEYDIRVTAPGYQPQAFEVAIAQGETTTLDVMLTDSEEIALLASSVNQKRLTTLLEASGYSVTSFDRSDHAVLKDNIEDYALVLMNDSVQSVTEDEFSELIEAADEAHVSMLFGSQFGGGGINDLRDYFSDPQSTSQGFVENEVLYEVKEEHPIFRGYTTGDTIPILENEGASQQYHVFEEYSGTPIADVVHKEDGRIGGGVAYDFRSSNHVHVLLGSLGSSTYGHPESRWTEDAKTIFINTIDWALSASLGEINGKVETEAGEPIENATVTIESENKTVRTNDQGRYTLGIGMGEYTVSVKALGYKAAEKNVVVEEVGDVVELNFRLEAEEETSLYGHVTDQATGDALEGVTVTALSTDGELELMTKTDQEGAYQLTDLTSGEFEVNFEKEGFNTVTKTLVFESGDHVEVDVAMSEFDIAVLGDYKSELSDLLKEQGLAAVSVDWNIIDHVELYDVVIVNTGNGTNEEMEKLIDRSDEHETSLVFLDTWGPDGSLELLQEVLGQPALDQQGYDEEAVILHTDKSDHPMFDGFDSDEIKILTEKSPYATFTEYDGNILADVSVGDSSKGSVIGFEPRGNQHVHLIMSTFAVNNMVGPERGWTDDGKQMFAQAVQWAKDVDAEGEGPELTIDNPIDGERTNKEVVTVEGTVDVENLDYIAVNGEKADVTIDGRYSKRIMVENGENVIEVVAVDLTGYSTTETVTIDVKYNAPEISNLTPEKDQFIETGESVKIEFESEPGARATFVIHMPLTNSTGSQQPVTELPMMEMSDGRYVGYWTVTNAIAEGAVIEIIVKDRYGNITRKQADGKLFINVDDN